MGLLLGLSNSGSAAMPAPRVDLRRQSFSDDWQFSRGDPPQAQRPSFDDSKWMTRRLPHDWAIDGPFDSKMNPHTGALPISGVGWYRKTFSLPVAARRGFTSVEFDGAMAMRESG